MLFNSFAFFGFLSFFAAAYFATPRRYRYVVVAIGSYAFYMQWRAEHALLLFAITAVDFTIARAMSATASPWVRRGLLASALAFDYGLLVYFKYANFLYQSFVDIGRYFDPSAVAAGNVWDVVLPIGISFFIFQSTGYLIDVFAGRQAPERNFVLYSAFVTFFPQLVAGPIERADNLMPQIRDGATPRWDQLTSGGWLILYGLFKKMCVADLVAPVVDGVYGSPESYNGTYLAIATVLFAVQIYGDFSGYTDIARGVARCLGVELRLNFRRPYRAASVTEFWQRWHISLSTWFRDYLYLPLGGNRVAPTAWVRNIVIVFAVSGLWHGAAWTFVLWGLVHAAAVIIERFTGSALPRPERVSAWRRGAGRVWTLSVVLIGWMFFRAGSFDNLTAILGGLTDWGPIRYGTFKSLGLPSFEILAAAIHIAVLFTVDRILDDDQRLGRWSDRTLPFRPLLAVALLYDILLFGVVDKIDFIYFQF